MSNLLFKPVTIHRIGRSPPTPREYLIEGMLGARHGCVLVAPQKIGKSAIAGAINHAICSGAPLFGRAVKQGAALYLAAEKRPDVERRAHALHGEGIETAPFGVLSRIDLHGDDHAAAKLIDAVNRFSKEVGQHVVLLTVDTFAASFGRGDENSTRDVNRVTGVLDEVREATGVALLVLHHTLWDGKRGRGSTALPAWADVTLMIRQRRKCRTLEILEANTLEAGPLFEFTNIPDATGQVPIAVPWSPEQDKPGTSSSAAVMGGVPGSAAAALRVLKALDLDGGSISVEQWREAVYREFSDRTGDARRRAFFDARKILVDRELIEVIGDTVSVRKREFA